MSRQNHLSKGLFLILGLALLGAGPAPPTDDLIRQGNEAFARGDYDAALDFYGQAEPRTTDPGLGALNEGVALYRLGRYREADLRFRRSLEDAQGPRLARLQYCLGNCLVQEARSGGKSLLEEAIRLYERCLQNADAEPALREETQHNLELARQLWARAKAAPDSADEQDPQQEERNQQPRPDNLANAGPPDDGSGKAATAGAAEPIAGQAGNTQAPAVPTEKTLPGKGNLPPVPDQDELAPLTPEDVAEHLKLAKARIQRERQDYRQRPMPAPPANVPDW
jgi:hypothetical protein